MVDDGNRTALLEELRALRRTAKGFPRAWLNFECHSRSCAVRQVRVEIEERQAPFQPLVKCPRYGRELLFSDCDPR
jgi:hypothetical protein